ncbi:flagellar filament capping protein FliD [Vibrio parahaemolyticus]|uniref:Flagellar hook-associated protein 2 n=1 Tax=Vibrio parahaemolyticus TaxID=670 RepID=A0AA46Z3U5_VIBPH|nr:flagellar filament capping protein FliD [Vibrio parahaemolyticus]EHR1011908.1 flagellar filament capping protein FliD [Vibrio parahaemolyticus]EXJ44651.1 flagellar hook-associated family protein [Vibrio parahaemolyticus VPTS-2010_2]MCC3847266.1 flagellar filament capping protein FliD [Vibrio parahaemolyticus]UYV28103.1 flagellar filament capping protein FliD [Vibrio parahaemolyticus]HCJ4874068.1 flagellar filament capping protein FliD [Vibrio parahaemolyticus]
MSSFDPISMATQLATYDVQPFQQRYSLQASKYQEQLSALGKVESALRDFRTALNEMNSSTSSIIKNSATTSQEGFFSANADASAMGGNYQIFVEQVATAHQVSTGMPATLDATTEIPLTGTLEFTIDGTSMTLDLASVDKDGDGKATMSDLTSAINNHTDNPGVNATLVRSNGQTHFMLSSTETGVANTINVSASGTGQAWFEDAFANLSDISTPQDAVIWLGAETTGLKLTNSSNTFEGMIDGVDITVSKAQTSGEAPISLNVGTDNEGTKEQLDKFVETYNNLVSTIDKYTQIGGEDKARGALVSDPTLRSIESQLSGIIRGEHGGMRLGDIGLSLDRSGKLTVDQDKFNTAQQNNSAGLEAMFNGEGALIDSLDAMAEPFLKFSSGAFKSRKEALQSSLERIEDKQTGLERKYKMSYDRYLKQFTQMNSLMTQMNQTMSMFG